MRSRPVVALIRGDVRYDNVFKALEKIEPSITEKLANSYRIVIKPDFLLPNLTTSVDAVRAALDFIGEFTNKEVTVAEGLFSGAEIQPAFHNALLHELGEDYGLKYVDLNRDDSVTISLGNELSVNVARTIIDSDFRISLAVPKLERGAFSAGLENIAIGSVIARGKKNGKQQLLSTRHFGPALAELLKVVKPSLSLVDGFFSSVNGKAAETGFCVASADGVAADAVSVTALSKRIRKPVKKPVYLALCSKAGFGQSAIGKINVI